MLRWICIELCISIMHYDDSIQRRVTTGAGASWHLAKPKSNLYDVFQILHLLK